jgi:DNA-binding CsgD family transcriptional regulator
MHDPDSLARFVDETRDAPAIQAMLGPLRREIARLGFAHMHYETMRPHLARPRPPAFINNYPAAWTERYIEQGYETFDPTMRHGRTAIRPFVWQDTWRGRIRTRSEARVMREAEEFGLRSGGFAPVHSPGGAGWAYLSVASDMAPAEFARLFAARAPTLLLLTAYLHEAFPPTSVHGTVAPIARLTPREVDILSWMARGKTRGEAATILGISEHTAKDHLERARRKLDASTATHAVAIALSQGQLRL